MLWKSSPLFCQIPCSYIHLFQQEHRPTDWHRTWPYNEEPTHISQNCYWHVFFEDFQTAHTIQWQMAKAMTLNKWTQRNMPDSGTAIQWQLANSKTMHHPSQSTKFPWHWPLYPELLSERKMLYLHCIHYDKIGVLCFTILHCWNIPSKMVHVQ